MSAGIIQARANLEAHLPELRKFLDLSNQHQGEFIEALSRDQIDLALTLRNSHVATLMPHDLVTWARIAERTEVQRDYWKDRVESAEVASVLARADLLAEQRTKRHWRIAACLLGFAWALASVAVFL